MEKLENVLRYKFWISFGAAILLPAVGWYLAKGSMSAEVNKRWTAVDNNFKKDLIKDSTRDSTIAKIPNNKYIEGLKAINAVQSTDLQQARAYLRDAQKQYMVWPAIVSETMARTGYRQEPPDPDAKFKYGNVYRQELERVRKIITPIDEKIKKGKGLIYAPEGILPKARDEDWVTMGAPLDRMWDAQEDVWLLTSIMQAIAAVNKDATSIIDAPVKAIQEISLRGGSKAAPKPAQSKGSEKAPTPRTPAAPAVIAGDVRFNPVEEFGPEVVAAPPARPSGAEDDVEHHRQKSAKVKSRKEETSPSAAANSVKRYIEGDNTTPSKTRGFYLVVAMDHTFVPELLSQLSNMPWPTEIVRVQQSDEVTRNVIAGRVETAPSSPVGFGAQPAGAGRGRIDPSALLNIRSKGKEDKADEEQKEEQKQLLVSPATGTGLAPKAIEKDLVSAALDDPYVGLVVIAGTMTIYKPNEAPAKPQPTQQKAQPKPGEAQQLNKPSKPASPQQKQGGDAQKQGNPQQKQGNLPPAQNNPPAKQANPPTAQPKQGGNPSGPQVKQPASESKAGPNAATAGKKPQPDAPAKPPTPGK